MSRTSDLADKMEHNVNHFPPGPHPECELTVRADAFPLIVAALRFAVADIDEDLKSDALFTARVRFRAERRKFEEGA